MEWGLFESQKKMSVVNFVVHPHTLLTIWSCFKKMVGFRRITSSGTKFKKTKTPNLNFMPSPLIKSLETDNETTLHFCVVVESCRRKKLMCQIKLKQNKQNNNLVMQVKNGSFLNKSEILNPKKIKNVSFGPNVT
jgi:hypothetical protein